MRPRALMFILPALLATTQGCDAPTGTPGTGPGPTISLAEPLPFANGVVEAASVTLKYVVRDAHEVGRVGWRGWRTLDGRTDPASADVQVRGGAVVTGEVTIPVEAGAYEVVLVAIEPAHGMVVGTGDTLRFTVIDTRAPVVSLVGVADGAIVTDSAIRISSIEDASRAVSVTYRNRWLRGELVGGFRGDPSAATSAIRLFWGANAITVTATDPSGNSTTLSATVRRHPPDLATFTDMEGDLRSGCAIDPAGIASCWTSYPMQSYAPHADTRPVVVPGGVAFLIAPTAGDSHCAIATDGATRCWGMARGGSLGNGDGRYLVTYDTPQAVGGPALSRIADGGDFSCAVAADGLAWCWGSNYYQQLGTATTEMCWSVYWNQPVQNVPCSTVPVRVASDARWLEMATGRTHACGITIDGAAYCWGTTGGWEGSGALGTGVAADTAIVPKPVGTGLRFTSIGASDGVTCAVATDGAGYCWGAVPAGLSETATPYTPARIVGGHTFRSIGGSCGLTTYGKIRCWGTGPLYDGQPVPLHLDLTFTSVSASHRCGVATDGRAYCWNEGLEPIPLRAP